MILAFLRAVNGFSQTPADFALLHRAFQPAANVRLTEQYSDSRKNPNELQALLSGFFLVYKSYISSQDQNHCNFAPSCSEYGLQAVKKFGVVKGVISTLDRLTRCNGLSPELYEFDPQRRILLDPVQW